MIITYLIYSNTTNINKLVFSRSRFEKNVNDLNVKELNSNTAIHRLLYKLVSRCRPDAIFFNDAGFGNWNTNVWQYTIEFCRKIIKNIKTKKHILFNRILNSVVRVILRYIFLLLKILVFKNLSPLKRNNYRLP